MNHSGSPLLTESFKVSSQQISYILARVQNLTRGMCCTALGTNEGEQMMERLLYLFWLRKHGESEYVKNKADME